jgi:hypothetical protein
MQIRRWDDEAKVPGAPTLALDEVLDVVLGVVPTENVQTAGE